MSRNKLKSLTHIKYYNPIKIRLRITECQDSKPGRNINWICDFVIHSSFCSIQTKTYFSVSSSWSISSFCSFRPVVWILDSYITKSDKYLYQYSRDELSYMLKSLKSKQSTILQEKQIFSILLNLFWSQGTVFWHQHNHEPLK